jgi:hypothetical protein
MGPQAAQTAMQRFLAYLIALILLLAIFSVLPAQSRGILRLMSEADHERLLKSIPLTDDPVLESLRHDPRLMVYTDREIPPVFQAANNGLLGIFRAGTTFVVGGRVVGDGSNRFPWRRPAGLDDAVGWTSFNFIWLPIGQQIEISRIRLPGDVQGARSFAWTFPDGTVLGEVFQSTGDPSRPTWEMRIRRKLGPTSWRPDVFRPFGSRQELDDAVAMSGDPLALRFIETKIQEHWQFRTSPLSSPLRKDAVKDMLPALSRDTVKHLLGTPFASVREKEWVDGGLAPDTSSAFHVVPPGYNGANLSVSQASCASCHRTAGHNVRSFGMVSPSGWDEWIKGNVGDESFRFHPFDPSSVSSNRNFVAVRFNRRMVEAGMLRLVQ